MLLGPYDTQDSPAAKKYPAQGGKRLRIPGLGVRA